MNRWFFLKITTRESETNDYGGRITATIRSGGRYSVGRLSTKTTFITDNDIAAPRFDISGPNEISEGSTIAMVVSRTDDRHALTQNYPPLSAVQIMVHESGDMIPGAFAKTFETTFARGQNRQTIVIPTSSDDAFEHDSEVRIDVKHPDYGHHISDVVTVVDNDLPGVTLRDDQSGFALVDHEDYFDFTLQVERATESPRNRFLSVNFGTNAGVCDRVTKNADDEYVWESGSCSSVDVEPTMSSVRLRVRADRTSGNITARILPGNGYRVGPVSTVSATINDTDPTRNIISIGAPRRAITEGQSVTYTLVRCIKARDNSGVNLGTAGSETWHGNLQTNCLPASRTNYPRNVTVRYSTNLNGARWRGFTTPLRTVTFGPGVTTRRITASVPNDSDDVDFECHAEETPEDVRRCEDKYVARLVTHLVGNDESGTHYPDQQLARGQHVISTLVKDNDTTSLPQLSLTNVGSRCPGDEDSYCVEEGSDISFVVTRTGSTRRSLSDIGIFAKETGDTLDRDYPTGQPGDPQDEAIATVVSFAAGRRTVRGRIRTVADRVIETDPSTVTVRLKLKYPHRYSVAGNHTIEAHVVESGVRDANAPVLAIARANDNPVVEGGTAVFEISRVGGPDDEEVAAVVDVQNLNSRHKSRTTVIVPAGQASVTFDVTVADDDGITSPELRRVVAALVGDAAYYVNGQTARVEQIAGNDSQVRVVGRDFYEPGHPHSGTSREGVALTFVSDDPNATPPVVEFKTEVCGGACVVDATAGTDYTAITTLMPVVWENRGARVSIAILPDDHDDSGEGFRVVFNAGTSVKWANANGFPLATGTSYTVLAIIWNEGPLPAKWLAEFSHRSGLMTVDAVMERFGLDDEGTSAWVKLVDDSVRTDGINADVTGGMFGIETKRGDYRIGAALAGNQSSGTYGDSRHSYEVGGRQAGVYPYIQWFLGDGSWLWGIGGLAYGETSLESVDLSKTDSEFTSRLVAIGNRAEGFGTKHWQVDLDNDAVWIWSESETNSEFRATDTHSYRYRTRLTGSRPFNYENIEFVLHGSTRFERHGGDIEERNEFYVGGGVAGQVDEVSFKTGIEREAGGLITVALGLGFQNEHLLTAIEVRGNLTEKFGPVIDGTIAYHHGSGDEGMVVEIGPTLSIEGRHQMAVKVGYGFAAGKNEVVMPIVEYEEESRKVGLELISQGQTRLGVYGIRRPDEYLYMLRFGTTF
ncbi:MAG: hypothetical protein OXF11_05520 [Deltaproteobacteria bacterium]|nr:hypothetical protein [Deltaproteobacteria bacterium]